MHTVAVFGTIPPSFENMQSAGHRPATENSHADHALPSSRIASRCETGYRRGRLAGRRAFCSFQSTQLHYIYSAASIYIDKEGMRIILTP